MMVVREEVVRVEEDIVEGIRGPEGFGSGNRLKGSPGGNVLEARW